MLPKSLKEAKINKKNLTNDEIYCIIRGWIQDQIDLARRKQESDESFDSPAWSERQAYTLGLIKGLDKVSKYLPLTKGNENV